MSEGLKKTKYAATRRLHLKSKLLKTAASMLVAESEEKTREKKKVVEESFPPLKLSGLSVQELQDLCTKLYSKIDVADEARYDLEITVTKKDEEIEALKKKVTGLKDVKRPNLRKVKKVGDDTSPYTDTARQVKADFKIKLKTVKKEEEKREEVTDWRKNVEAKHTSGMEGRKKQFDAGQ